MSQLATLGRGASSHPLEDERGHPLLSIGFRPFFLGATVSAVLLVPAWLLVLALRLVGPYWRGSAFHAHEMLFGYATAVAAGFLLTAGSNWTQRRMASRPILGGLVVVWLLGRLVPLLPEVPAGLVAAVDLAFLPLLAVVLGRGLLAAGSRRNYVFVVLLLGLFLANGLMHAGALRAAYHLAGREAELELGSWGQVLALRILTLMMLVMGGRVIPLFTRNATGLTWIGAVAALELAGTVLFVAAATLEPILPAAASGVLWVCAGLVGVGRMASWGSWKARVPLLWILHFGALAVALSFVFEGLAAFGVVPLTTARHLLTVGGVGGLTLGMMTRVTLGHSGRLLVAPRSMTVAFWLLVLSTLVRALGPWLFPSALAVVLLVSGVAWSLAFALLLHFGWPIWLRPRLA